jgi:Histidine kinase-, DNA gyrase B-, and HSP90-like ATPase
MTEGMKPQISENEVDVMPTKALFVDMLTRDIPIDRAIIDLIDNSIDGAMRLRGDKSLEELEVRIDLSREGFQISDNCGGISIDHAKNFAFRFGRPKGVVPTPGSVGQFGVGMKRALFRFGRFFEVESTTVEESFKVSVDVDEWKSTEDKWTFEFKETHTALTVPIDQTGTVIRVSGLHDNVSDSFGDARFKISLARQIEMAQQHYIDRGLTIVVDNKTLITTPWTLFSGSGIQPAHTDQKISLPSSNDPIFVRIYAGVSKSDPKNSGWYVLCNGRMLLEADQTSATGWSELAETVKVAIPKFHNQFSRFRGYVFFDCQDTSLLPWNTTKTGVDEDNSIYKNVKLKMMEIARPIIDFLNDLDSEKEYVDTKDKVLEGAVTSAASVRLSTIPARAAFGRPPAVRAPQTVSIQYRREKELVDELKEAFGAGSARSVGEHSFDFAYAKLVEGE